MKNACIQILILGLLLFSGTAYAAEQRFGWPVACTLNQDCWIVNYVDADPAANSSKDFTCGDMTYDGHDGTDIAIRDHQTITDNIGVLAAADGEVLRTRDGTEDGDGSAAVMAAVKDAGKECGNGVVIAHGNGWETFYCHMKKGSIAVKPGQHVQKGDRLGSVGQSGYAEFPHVHFGVKHDHTTVDPFTGKAAQGCGVGGAVPMWAAPVEYNPLLPYAAGLSDREPVYAQLVQDTSALKQTTVDAPLLAFWILAYGAQPGDIINMEILDPTGKSYVRNEYTQGEKQARMMRYIGARTRNKPVQAGVYTGKATLRRALSGGGSIERTVERLIIVEEKR